MIYVEPLADYGMIYNFRGQSKHRVKSCHLIGDEGREKLISFAKSIGIKMSWLHRSNKGLDHFDLMRGKRVEAVKMGAVELTLKEWNDKSKEIIKAQ